MERDDYTLAELCLPVGDGHELYVQDWGNPKAKQPTIFLKGGPGGACKQRDKARFDPRRDRVIFFDQRGCGQSTPYGSLEHNTTQDLIADITKIADHCKLKTFVLTGTSWGSALALYYALAQPERVSALVIGGVFTGSQTEIDWLDQGRFQTFYPDAWEAYLNRTPESRRNDPSSYHFDKVLHGTPKEQAAAAYAYSCLEGAVVKLDDRFVPDVLDDTFDPLPMRIEMYYMANGCFVPDRYVFDNLGKLTMPVYMVQGRYDMVCPPATAYELHQKLPVSELYFTMSGHLSEHETQNIFSSLFARLNGGT